MRRGASLQAEGSAQVMAPESGTAGDIAEPKQGHHGWSGEKRREWLESREVGPNTLKSLAKNPQGLRRFEIGRMMQSKLHLKMLTLAAVQEEK